MGAAYGWAGKPPIWLLLGIFLSGLVGLAMGILQIYYYGRPSWLRFTNACWHRYPWQTTGLLVMLIGVPCWEFQRQRRLFTELVKAEGRTVPGTIEGGARWTRSKPGGLFAEREVEVSHYLEVSFCTEGGAWVNQRFWVPENFAKRHVEELPPEEIARRDTMARQPKAEDPSQRELDKTVEQVNRLLEKSSRMGEAPSEGTLPVIEHANVMVRYLPKDPTQAILVGGEPEYSFLVEYGGLGAAIAGLGMMVRGFLAGRSFAPRPGMASGSGPVE